MICSVDIGVYGIKSTCDARYKQSEKYNSFKHIPIELLQGLIINMPKRLTKERVSFRKVG